MKIYLIRHGKTTGDIENRYGGDYDDNLSPKGVRESKELAKKLKDVGIQIIYVSPRIRAIETASIVNNVLKVKIKIIDGLRERNNYGILTGLIKSEAKERYPNEVKELENGANHKVKNSENYQPFKKRIIKGFNDIANGDKYSVIAIITHGGPIRCLIREVFKAGELSELGDCTVITISKTGKNLLLESLNGAKLENGLNKSLKFYGRLPNLILSGKKTTTWRINDDKNLSAGDEIWLIKKETLSKFAKAKILSVRETTLGKLTKGDRKGHEHFESDKEMYINYSKLYKTKVTPKTKLKIIKFRLLK